ncbi:hypothetical protein [Pseudomonas sp. SWRI99]|uniref:hypothetical protein n=1 Tax=Pseudomonas sp. SWRI99 TaxID=2745506 RepID=UPI00164728D1|nr:hypothetical protein [Pseudomonas sp. SWRI99]MBC3776734.1 hypothetical protein [Pseudomonas sp. SWRI99]
MKIKEQLLLDPYENDLVVIYHDFNKIEKGAISGEEFAACVKAYQESLGGTAHLVHANGSYEALISALRDIGRARKDHVYRLIIATHGNQGQLWLGNPNEIKHEWVVAEPEQGKAFISPVTFGTLLKEIFGPGLSISVLSCYFARKEAASVATAIRQAAEATVLYAGTDMVYLNGAKGGRPTASCTGAMVVFKAAAIEVNAKNIPVFEAFPAK